VRQDGNAAGDGGIDLVAVAVEQLADLVEPGRGYLVKLERARPALGLQLVLFRPPSSSCGHRNQSR